MGTAATERTQPTQVNRALPLITASVAISSLGTWSYNVGIAVFAYEETGSTAWVAVATVGRYLPALLLTWYGARWADRYPRRNVAVVADLVCAVSMFALTVVAASHGSLVLAIALAAFSSGVARIQGAAALSVAADLVVESQLARSTVLISTYETAATALGPALASVVLAFSTPAVLFAVNGVTFGVSALLLAGLRPPARDVTGTQSAQRSPAGDRHAYHDVVRVVWPLLAARTVAAFVYGVDVVLLAVLATEQLRQGTAGYGWLLAAAGAGGLLAALALRRSPAAHRVVALTAVGLTLYALPLLVFDLQPALVGSIAVQILRGFGCVLVTATVVTALQRLVPSSSSVQVFGLAHVLVLAGTCTGALAAPVLLHAAGLEATVAVAALLPVVALLVILPGLLRLDRGGSAAAAALDPKVDILRRLVLFQDASRSMLYHVADRAEQVEMDPGIEVVAEGDRADALFVLLTGEVDVSVRTPQGRSSLRRMEGPAYFGEIGLIHGVARTATVTTTAPCVLWRVPADAFLTVASQAGLSNALTDTVRVRFDPPSGPSGLLTSSDV